MHTSQLYYSQLAAGIKLANKETRHSRNRLHWLETQLLEKENENARIARVNRKLRRHRQELENKCRALKEEQERLIECHQAEVALLRLQLEKTIRLAYAHAQPSEPPVHTPRPCTAIRESRQYLIGQRIVNDTQGFTGLLRLPQRLGRLSRAYANQPDLPAIVPSDYDDARKAARHEHHLSYRLGCIAVKHAHKGARPWCLCKMYIAFRQFKREHQS